LLGASSALSKGVGQVDTIAILEVCLLGWVAILIDHELYTLE